MLWWNVTLQAFTNFKSYCVIFIFIGLWFSQMNLK
jgi:hypothetical protein